MSIAETDESKPEALEVMIDCVQYSWSQDNIKAEPYLSLLEFV